MTNYANSHQIMLMPTPEAHRKMPDKPATPEGGGIGQSAVTATTIFASLATMLVPIPDTVEGVMLVDPRAIVIDPVNVRHGVPFDPTARGELIENMRAVGNTVPVRLRCDPGGSLGFQCLSESQRCGAALYIQQHDPRFRLRAIIADTMSDKEAFAIAEADNAGRSGITAMQRRGSERISWSGSMAAIGRNSSPRPVGAGQSSAVPSVCRLCPSTSATAVRMARHCPLFREATGTAPRRCGGGAEHPSPRRSPDCGRTPPSLVPDRFRRFSPILRYR